MKHLKISIITDSVLTYFFCLLLFFSVIGRNVRPNELKISIGLIVCLVPAVTVAYLSVKNQEKIQLDADKTLAENTLTEELCLYTDEELLNLFCPLFDNMQIPYSIKHTRFFDNKIIILYDKYVCYFDYVLNDLQQTDVIKAVKRIKNTEYELLYFCKAEPTNAPTLQYKKLNVHFIDIPQVYNLLDKYGLLPKTDVTPKTNKIKTVLQGLKDKKRAKRFFLSGCALLLLSLFVFYPVYYTVTGCLLIFFAFCIRFFGETLALDKFELSKLAQAKNQSSETENQTLNI